MMTSLIAALCLISFAVADPAPPVTEVATDEQTALDSTRRLLAHLTAADEFSGVVLVARHGKPIFREAYGYANRERRHRNRTNTKFNVGSVNKVFTWMAIERLIDQGRLRFDTRVGDVLPDYPNAAVRDSVTVDQLLNHQSGVPDFFNEDYERSSKDSIRTLRDYLRFFADKPLEFSPGADRKYSNGGFIILGLIIEKLTGQSYYEHIRETIYKPLRMRNSAWYAVDDRVKHRALGYTREGSAVPDSGPWRPNTNLLPARGSSAGGGYSTMDDLLKFFNALARGDIGSNDWRSGRLGLGGGAAGLNARIDTGINNTYTVIVLANFDPPAADSATEKIAAWFTNVRN